jgi:hypothetical protein
VDRCSSKLVDYRQSCRVYIPGTPELLVSLISFRLATEFTNSGTALFANRERPSEKAHGHIRIFSKDKVHGGTDTGES